MDLDFLVVVGAGPVGLDDLPLLRNLLEVEGPSLFGRHREKFHSEWCRAPRALVFASIDDDGHRFRLRRHNLGVWRARIKSPPKACLGSTTRMGNIIGKGFWSGSGYRDRREPLPFQLSTAKTGSET